MPAWRVIGIPTIRRRPTRAHQPSFLCALSVNADVRKGLATKRMRVAFSLVDQFDNSFGYDVFDRGSCDHRSTYPLVGVFHDEKNFWCEIATTIGVQSN
jgi:hypothetical protein